MAWLRVRSITGERGCDGDIALPAAAQVAGLDLHGISVPQAVQLVDEAVRVHRRRGRHSNRRDWADSSARSAPANPAVRRATATRWTTCRGTGYCRCDWS